eukprot:jgi/Tetstr1/430326/TSEL_020151.t1
MPANGSDPPGVSSPAPTNPMPTDGPPHGDAAGPSGVAKPAESGESPGGVASPPPSSASSDGLAEELTALKVLTLPERPKREMEMEMAVSPSARLLTPAGAKHEAWVCGANDAGQLGIGHAAPLRQPTPIPGAPVSWAALAQGDRHSAAVDAEGQLFTWGALPPLAASGPCKVALRGDEKVLGLCCGSEHGVAVTETRVFAWGSSTYGQCGSGGGGGGRGRSGGDGGGESDGGSARSAGGSSAAGEGEAEEGSAEEVWVVSPLEIGSLTGKHVTQVAAGRHHTLCVTATSQVYAWGRNNHGQLGTGAAAGSGRPRVVEGLWAIPVRQLAAGDAHSAALTCHGFLFTWGRNSVGQLGLPSEPDIAAPSAAASPQPKGPPANQKMLGSLLDMGISKARAEMALRETGNSGVEVAAEWLFSHAEEDFDAEEDGEHATPSKAPQKSGFSVDLHWLRPHGDKSPTKKGKAAATASAPTSPTRKAEPPAAPCARTPRRVPLQGVTYVACGGDHTVVLLAGAPMAWGSGLLGQLGSGVQQHSREPQAVSIEGSPRIRSVACGDSHTLFLAEDGAVYGCGDNSHGQLGLRGAEGTVDPPRQLSLELKKRPGGLAPGVIWVCAGSYSSGFLVGPHLQLGFSKPEPSLHDRLQSALTKASQQAKIGSETSEMGYAPGGGPGLHPHISLFHLLTAVKLVFSSAAAMSAVFGLPSQVGINVELLDKIQSQLVGMGSDLINATLYKSTLYLLDDVYHKLHLLGTAERVQVLLAASQSPLLAEPKFAAHLLPRLCTVILSASSRHPSCRRMLQRWWAEYPAAVLHPRLVQPLQGYLTSELMKLKKLTVNVMNCIKLLDEVFRANMIGRKLNAEDFHNELISEKLDVLDHYIAWRQSRETLSNGPSVDGPFSFCSYPFLLNCKAKSKLLQTEAKIRMETTVAQARLEQSRRHTLGRIAQAEDERVLPLTKSHSAMEAGSSASATGSSGRRVRLRQSGSNRTGGVMRGFIDMLLGGSHGEHHREPASSSARAERGESSSSSSSGVTREPSPHHVPSDAQRRQMASEIHRTSSLSRTGSMCLPTPNACGVPERHQDHCILRVRRTHIMPDALEEISRQRTKDLLKPLRVHFIGEDGIDAGGVRKEFFQLLVNDLLRPDYGMLQYFDESRVFWFNPSTLEAKEEFMLIGIIMGLAIYNTVLLDLPLPQVLYKKLLKQAVGLHDLEEMQPILGRSLKQLLQYEGEPGSVEAVFCQTFAVDIEAFGEVRPVELKAGGSDVPVTEDNRREFVELYTEYILTESIKPQFEAFSKGFMMVCGGPALNLFHAQELEALVCGEDRLDFDALRKNARYDGGYNAESQAVMWLWEIVLQFTDTEKHQFLKFYTGSDRAPIGGLGSMRSVIQRDGGDTGKLPTSHTCFNTLLLPEYASLDKMRALLRLAILNAEGFGLE